MTSADSLIARRPRKGSSLLGNLDVQNGGFKHTLPCSQPAFTPKQLGAKPLFCTSAFPNKEDPFRGLLAISESAPVIFQSKPPMQNFSSIYSGCERLVAAVNACFFESAELVKVSLCVREAHLVHGGPPPLQCGAVQLADVNGVHGATVLRSVREDE